MIFIDKQKIRDLFLYGVDDFSVLGNSDLDQKVIDIIDAQTEYKYPVKGKWERIFDDRWIFECSNCHSRHSITSDFCPSCGAYLKEEL